MNEKMKIILYLENSRLQVIKEIYVKKCQTVSFGHVFCYLIIQRDIILFSEV